MYVEPLWILNHSSEKEHLSWSSLKTLRTPPVPVLFSVGSEGSTSFKPPLPLPPDSSCVSSPVSEVPEVLWAKLCCVFPYANLSCKNWVVLVLFKFMLGSWFFIFYNSLFWSEPNGLQQYPLVFKNNAKCALPEIHLCYSCQPCQCTWIPAVLSFLLDLHNNYWLCH